MKVSFEGYERSRDAVVELLRKRRIIPDAGMDVYLPAAEIVTATLYALDPSGEWRAPLEAEAADKKRAE